MSYEIYYDKRFIKVKGGIIPIVQVGDNNAFQQINGRDVPEKSWRLMNYPFSAKVIFTAQELTDLYLGPTYEKDMHKSRQSYHVNFGKWLVAGIKSAMTIEEHTKLGNKLRLDYHCGEEWLTADFSTEKDFWDAFHVVKKLNAKRLNLAFARRDIRKPALGSRTPANGGYYNGYYSIKSGDNYFQKTTTTSYYFGADADDARKFKTADMAEAYIVKNLKINDYEIDYIESPCKL